MSLCNHTQFSRDSYFDGVDCVQYIYVYMGESNRQWTFVYGYVNLSEAIWQKPKPQTQQILDLIRNQQKNTNSNIK